ncbi:MAG: protein-tyrosine-phosphatase [Saprospiraceae bacterium]|nr:protein-tyrosine-phosphatase [Saprospiraceae bacterium]MDW8229311.1 protein-tyrosine-phosphatase [Saprospiraceae bacterium]
MRQPLFPSIEEYLRLMQGEAVPSERLPLLHALAAYLAEVLRLGRTVRLNFICTHNSRRSHLAQAWAQVAAHRYGLAPVECYSGGTEATACNPRTVAALERAGLKAVAITKSENPVYLLYYADGAGPIVAFSKVYDQPPNPREGFAAVMTCAQAEENCPVVFGAERRFALTYDDPKAADDTPEETATYDARCRQIAAEMRYVFARVAEEMS